MTLEPRQVEPGALKRWLIQGFGLVRREVGGWVLLTLVFVLISPFASLFLTIPLIIVPTCVYGLKLCAKADRRELVQTSLFFLDWRSYLTFLAWLVGLLVVTALATRAGLSGPTLPSETLVTGSLFAGELLTMWLTLGAYLASVLLMLYHWILNGSFSAFGLHGYLAKAFHGLEPLERKALLRSGVLLNSAHLLSLSGVAMLALILSVSVPFVWALVLPMYCSIYYCAFRDIFLHETQNAPAPVKAKTLASAPSGVA